MKICRHCKEASPDDAKYCIICGEPFTSSQGNYTVSTLVSGAAHFVQPQFIDISDEFDTFEEIHRMTLKKYRRGRV